MSIFALADEQKMDAGFGAIEAPSTTFADVVKAAIPSTARNYLSNSKQFFEGLETENRNKAYKDLTGRNLFDDVRASRPDDPKLQAASEMKNLGDSDVLREAADQYINTLREQEPEKYGKISNSVEIGEVVRRKAREALAESEKASAGATSTARIAGELTGGVAASMIDPVNLATIPLGAGVAHGIVRTALIEAGANMATEAMTQPFVAEWQKELGQEYGLDEQLNQIGMAGLFGAGLGGGMKAMSVGFAKSKALFMNLAGRRMEELENIPAMRAAAHEERRLHIDEANPSRFNETVEPQLHREALSEVDTAMNESRAINSDKVKLSDEQVRLMKRDAMDEGAARVHELITEEPTLRPSNEAAKIEPAQRPHEIMDLSEPTPVTVQRQKELTELVDSPEWKAKEKSNFDERFKEDAGDERIWGEGEGEDVSVNELRQQFKDDEAYYSAISSCGLGGG